jgi:hypothetical protein
MKTHQKYMLTNSGDKKGKEKNQHNYTKALLCTISWEHRVTNASDAAYIQYIHLCSLAWFKRFKSCFNALLEQVLSIKMHIYTTLLVYPFVAAVQSTHWSDNLYPLASLLQSIDSKMTLPLGFTAVQARSTQPENQVDIGVPPAGG